MFVLGFVLGMVFSVRLVGWLFVGLIACVFGVIGCTILCVAGGFGLD